MVGLRKIIAELSFSPASVEKLAHKAHQLRQRQKLYAWAIIPLVALTIVTGYLALLPTSQNSPADDKTQSSLTQNLSNPNLSANIKVNQTKIQADGVITWQLTVNNHSAATQTDNLKLSIQDIANYAYITDVSSDGIVSDRHHYIIWPDTTLGPHQSLTLNVTGHINNPVPNVASTKQNPSINDCAITASFGNTVTTDVACSPLKQIELFLKQQPQLSSLTSLIISFVLLIATVVAHQSTRLQSQEIRIIRRQLNTGTIS